MHVYYTNYSLHGKLLFTYETNPFLCTYTILHTLMHAYTKCVTHPHTNSLSLICASLSSTSPPPHPSPRPPLPPLSQVRHTISAATRCRHPSRCVYVCVHTYTHVCMCVYIHIHMCVCMCIYGCRRGSLRHISQDTYHVTHALANTLRSELAGRGLGFS